MAFVEITSQVRQLMFLESSRRFHHVQCIINVVDGQSSALNRVSE